MTLPFFLARKRFCKRWLTVGDLRRMNIAILMRKSTVSVIILQPCTASGRTHPGKNINNNNKNKLWGRAISRNIRANGLTVRPRKHESGQWIPLVMLLTRPGKQLNNNNVNN